MNRKVIGVVGPLASGKGVVIRRLGELGYKIYSLSDFLRQTTKLLQLPPDREILQDVGDLLRKHAGNGVLAARTVEAIKETSDFNIGVDSIRNPDEIRILKEILGTKFIGVDATYERCFENMKIRGRDGDPTTWEEFLRLAQRDRGINQETNGQQVGACLELAQPHVILNDSTLEILRQRIDAELINLGVEGIRSQIEKK